MHGNFQGIYILQKPPIKSINFKALTWAVSFN